MAEGVLPDEVQIVDDHRMGFFITGSGDSTTAGEANSFDGRTIGTSLGVDWRLNDHCVTGISLSYSHSRSELMPVGKVNSDGAKVALYSLYHRGGFYTEGLIGGGYISYDIERSAFLGTARGSTNGAQFDAYLGMGYDIIREGWTVTPMISWLYTVVGIEGYNEIGSLVPLNIDSQHASSLRVRIGPRIAHTSQWGIASVTPSFSAQWQHEFLDDQLPFEARFSNAPGTPFTV
jgi:outer membrane autotransporter protein